jgi:hypothetical protein
VPPEAKLIKIGSDRYGLLFQWLRNVQGGGGYPKAPVVIGQHADQIGWLGWQETTGRCFVDWSLIEKLPRFTIVDLKNHRTQKSKSFKWQGKVYDCAGSEQTPPQGFRRGVLRDYCWFEKTTGPDILPESLYL